MSRKQISAHYARLLTLWPADALRPAEHTFQSLLRTRISDAPAGPARNESSEVNAAYRLLNNDFARRWPLGEKIMQPTSQPGYFRELEKELEEAPGRSWWERLGKRLKGMVRFR
ncbi:hypothetical protein M433DRAFT_592 [Acidomyces richmondensis BFW]|nr:MAG: hypothetical protein FE78DRAFT_30362 [Acidomyces sp. 'richmondensis']KYG50067.1 hypothetical protein M433DRAFT_592 [Acidomyces richmondensis BFW]